MLFTESERCIYKDCRLWLCDGRKSERTCWIVKYTLKTDKPHYILIIRKGDVGDEYNEYYLATGNPFETGDFASSNPEIDQYRFEEQPLAQHFLDREPREIISNQYVIFENKLPGDFTNMLQQSIIDWTFDNKTKLVQLELF